MLYMNFRYLDELNCSANTISSFQEKKYIHMKNKILRIRNLKVLYVNHMY